MTRDADIARIAAVLGDYWAKRYGKQDAAADPRNPRNEEAAAALYDAGLRPSVEPTCPDCEHDPHVAMCYAAGPMPGDGPCGCVSADSNVRPSVEPTGLRTDMEDVGEGVIAELVGVESVMSQALDRLRRAQITLGGGLNRAAVVRLLPTQASDSPEKTT